MSSIDDNLKSLIDSDEQRLAVEFLKGFSEQNKANEVVAIFLSWLQSFRTMLLVARHKLGIEPSLGLQFTIFESYRLEEIAFGNIDPPLSPKQLKKLSESIEEIIEYFCLTPGWRGSVRMAILVNIIYLPPTAGPSVSLTKPGSSIKSIPIYVTERVSVHELKSEINKLKPDLEEELATLPKRSSKKIDDETMRWGQAMWLARKQTNVFDTDRPFRLMRDKLVEMLEDDSIPSPTELRKYYERFLNYALKQQQPLSTHSPSSIKPED